MNVVGRRNGARLEGLSEMLAKLASQLWLAEGRRADYFPRRSLPLDDVVRGSYFTSRWRHSRLAILRLYPVNPSSRATRLPTSTVGYRQCSYRSYLFMCHSESEKHRFNYLKHLCLITDNITNGLLQFDCWVVISSAATARPALSALIAVPQCHINNPTINSCISLNTCLNPDCIFRLPAVLYVLQRVN